MLGGVRDIGKYIGYTWLGDNTMLGGVRDIGG
jgi:hypothetical protein